jgi:hypothetical protein
VNGCGLEGPRQGQNLGILADNSLAVFERFINRSPCLEAHTSGIARLSGTANINGTGVHFGYMAAGNHGEAVEGMEAVTEAVIVDIIPVLDQLFSVLADIGQSLVVVCLEHFVDFSVAGKELVMEPAITCRGANDNAIVFHNALVADNLGRQSLHNHDGVGAHAVTVVEKLRHTENHDVVFFFGEGNIGTLVGDFPRGLLDVFGRSGKDGNLSGLGVQDRITAPEFLAHFLFHVHTDFVEFMAHGGVVVNRNEVCLVHDFGDVVGGDGFPMGNTGRAVLVAAGITAVGVTLSMADQKSDIGLKDIAVHNNRVVLDVNP